MSKAAHVLRAHFFLYFTLNWTKESSENMEKTEYTLYQRLFEHFSSPEPSVSFGRELGRYK